MEKVISEFEQRYNTFSTKSEELKKQYTSLSWARVLTFSIGIVLIVILADNKSSGGLIVTTVIFLVIFLYLLKKHNHIRKERDFNIELAAINKEEILRHQGELSSFDQGLEFLEVDHPYHIDLDVYGKNSLFQLLNRTATQFGKQMLGDWLSKPESKQTIEHRSEAVKELGIKLDWRQNFQAYGRTYQEDQKGNDTLLDWLKEPNRFLTRKIYQIALFIMPVATMGSFLLWMLGYAPAAYFSLSILIALGFLGTVQTTAGDIYKKTVKSNQALKALEQHIKLIEEENFQSTIMVDLKSHFVNTNIKASSSIKEIQFILDSLHNRSNIMYWPLNLFFLLDIIWILKAERWKQKTKTDIEHWFKAVGEIECLNSLAGFHFANPEFAFPNISQKPFTVIGERIGHPLIKSQKRVSNDFDFSGKGGICLITGSNMSGKSTFLRTVGVNTVLALMGAPVCGKSLTISHLQVFTSMRTQDDLEESVSSFYAELKRLKKLIESINPEVPTLFMIDEVLKGTNSEDRHKGAIALIRQLNKTDAFGFVSTHDIELGKITNELQGVKNYSFNNTIEGDEIVFDYTLTQGICKSFNATKLMQKMGIEIIE